jgi:hypothetical protein
MVPASKAEWECGKLNRPVAGSKFKARPRAARCCGGGGTVQAADASWRPDLITGVCQSRSAPLVHMNKLTPTQVITPYQWVHLDEEG